MIRLGKAYILSEKSFSDTLPVTNPTRTGLGLNPSLRSKRPMTSLSTIIYVL